jgi:type VI secretion system protein VasG
MRQITELKLSKIKRRIEENHRAEFVYDNALVNAVASRCTEVDSGARNVDHILTGTLLPEIAETVLARMAEGKAIERVSVSVGDTGDFNYAIS